ncbi:MAG: LptF/LptG family permease [Candidatus Baltobacteraceae bacterium]
MASLPSVRAAPFAPIGVPRLPILDKYLIRELAGPFVFSLGAFLLFWFLNIFFLAADYLINAHAPFFVVFRFLLFRIPQSTPYAFPFACLFATLLAFGRLTSDNEITALRTSGVGFLRICRTPLILGACMFALCYWVNDTIVPKAVDLSTRTFYQIVYHTASLPIVPQIFRKDDQTGTVFYVGNVEQDHRTMDNVMIFQNATDSEFKEVISARTATVDGSVMTLKDARVTKFKRSGEYDGGTLSKTMQIGLPLAQTIEQFAGASNQDDFTLNSKQLGSEIKAMESTGQGGAALDVKKITLAQKFSFPFASFVAVLIALPLAVRYGRKGRTLGIALSILLFFAYFIMMSAFVALGRNGAFNPYLAAWIPNVVMAIAGTFLFWRVEH